MKKKYSKEELEKGRKNIDESNKKVFEEFLEMYEALKKMNYCKNSK